MKKLTALLFLTLFITGCENPSYSASESTSESSSASEESSSVSGEVVAVVNGVELPASRITVYAQSPTVSDADKEQIIENMIVSELISQKAMEQGFANDESVKDEIAVARQAVLGRAYASAFLDKNPISEETQDMLYQEMIAEAAGNQEYDVAHILVETEEEAKEILAQIEKDPSTFAALAEEHSSDPGSAKNGGKLGWVPAAGLVPEFADAMKALGKNELSKVAVQTTYGWHIIRVDDVREVKIPELDEKLRENLSQRKRAELLSEHIDVLRKDATVEIR